MRYRIYSIYKGKQKTTEVEVLGLMFRVCDDHGRVIYGAPFDKKKTVISTKTKEPSYYE